jgi:PAS domain S-box-containing protein
MHTLIPTIAAVSGWEPGNGASNGAVEALLELNPAPSWVYDEATHQIVAANAPALELYGYGREQFLAMSITALGEATEPVLSGVGRYRTAAGGVVAAKVASRRIGFTDRPAWLQVGIGITEEIEATRVSEYRFTQFFESGSDWYWERDAKGYLTYVSSNVEAHYGLSVSEMMGKRLEQSGNITIPPEMIEKALTAIKARKPFNDFVYSRVMPETGRKQWVRSNNIPVFDAAGKFGGYRGAAKDITAEVEADAALRENEKRFREMIEMASDYYWEIDTQHRLIRASPEAVYSDIYGEPLAQRLGTRLSESLNISLTPEMGRMALAAYKAKLPYRDFLFSVRHADGRLRWVSLSAMPMFTEDGTFLGYRGIGADITKRIESETRSRLAQSQVHDAVSYVTQPFAVFDAEDRAVAYNQAFTNLFRTADINTRVHDGVSLRSLGEWQVATNFFADRPGEPPIDLETLLGHHQTEEEHTYNLRDGRWMLLVYRRLPGGGKVCLWTDVTAMKRAEADRLRLEEQLHHSQRLEALGTLAGGVAHELNNALVPVIALSQLVMKKLPEESRERRNLATVVQASGRARDLVKQILAFARKQEHRRETFDLGTVIRDTLGMLRASMPATLTLEEMVLPAPLLAGDSGQMQQIIVNLVTNAADAIDGKHGTITIGLHPDPDGTSLRLSVADSGCGMSEATRIRIFEPFFTTKEVGKGTGLGLAVVHGIVKDHGGHIEIDSAPGRGTRFDIVLPAASAEPRPAGGQTG